MIKNFGDHAANERTFLAWVRTAIERVEILALLNSTLKDSEAYAAGLNADR
jgi:hypothetical protein